MSDSLRCQAKIAGDSKPRNPSIAQQILSATRDTVRIFWMSEVYSDSVAYEGDAKVFTFEDGSRIRIDSFTAELVS